MNQFPNQTSARGTRAGIRRGRHPRHPHRLHGFSRNTGEGQGASCRERRGQAFGQRGVSEGTGRPGGFARHGHPGHPGHPGRGHDRRAVHELHKALAEVARTGDQRLRGEAAQIVTEAAARLSELLAADR